MTVKCQRLEHRLASGTHARYWRIQPERFEVQPLFTSEATPAENRLAQVLGEARLQSRLKTVPPAARRLENPKVQILPELGSVTCLAERSLGAVEPDLSSAPLHLFRLAAAELLPGELFINGGYFLFLPPDIAGPWDAYGDPIGLSAASGTIETPPQIRRTCLVMTRTGPAIRRVGFSDVTVLLPDGRVAMAHPFGPPLRHTPFTAFALFHGSQQAATPKANDECDVAYVGRHPVAMKRGGGMPIPRTGCVLRLPGDTQADDVGPVTYELSDEIIEGVQAGPLIVENGQATNKARDIFTEELMHSHSSRPDDVPISPHRWAADWHGTRAARLAAGLSDTGQLFFCAVEGSSSFYRDKSETYGATLHDLACLMVQEGATTAMNLDGGGSTQVFCEGGGALLAPRDVNHAQPDGRVQYDRPMPLALKLG